MAQYVRVVQDDGGAGVIPLIPALVPPGYLIYEVWVFLTAHNWHPVFKLGASAGILLGIFYGIGFLYRVLPPPVSIFLSVVYMAATYWWAASQLGADPIWAGAAATAAGVAGFFGGRSFARENHVRPDGAAA